MPNGNNNNSNSNNNNNRGQSSGGGLPATSGGCFCGDPLCAVAACAAATVCLPIVTITAPEACTKPFTLADGIAITAKLAATVVGTVLLNPALANKEFIQCADSNVTEPSNSSSDQNFTPCSSGYYLPLSLAVAGCASWIVIEGSKQGLKYLYNSWQNAGQRKQTGMNENLLERGENSNVIQNLNL